MCKLASKESDGSLKSNCRNLIWTNINSREISDIVKELNVPNCLKKYLIYNIETCNKCYRKCGVGSFQCFKCIAWLHLACAGITKSGCLKSPNWLCVQCSNKMAADRNWSSIIDNKPKVVQPLEAVKSFLISNEENSTNSNNP